MAVGRVIHINQVFDLHFPVSMIEVSVHPSSNLNIAIRRADRNVVEKITVFAQPRVKIHSVRRHVCKHKTLATTPPGNPSQAVVDGIKFPVRIAFRLRDKIQIPISVIGPAVIHAHEPVR